MIGRQLTALLVLIFYFFQNFEQFFEEARELPVVTNYRSAKAIVNVGNALMKGTEAYPPGLTQMRQEKS